MIRITVGQIVARLVRRHVVFHVVVDRLGDVLDQLRIRVHLLDGRGDDGVEDTVYQARYERREIDRLYHAGVRRGALLGGDRASLRKALSRGLPGRVEWWIGQCAGGRGGRAAQRGGARHARAVRTASDVRGDLVHVIGERGLLLARQ